MDFLARMLGHDAVHKVEEFDPPAPLVVPPPHTLGDAETIEIILPDGCRLRVGNAVSTAMLRRVVAALRG